MGSRRPEEFLSYVHNVDLSPLAYPDPALRTR